MAQESIYKLLIEDYTNNFLPRKQIVITISFPKLLNALQDREVLQALRLTPLFKLYTKEVFLRSFTSFLDNHQSNPSTKDSCIADLYKFYKGDAQLNTSNEARAILFQILATYSLYILTKSDLHEAFSGTSIYDDYCAKIAFDEWNKRKAVH